MKHSLFVEKYRPENLDNFIGNSDIKKKLGEMISQSDIGNLLFYGKPGTGKTSMAKILVKSIDCDYLYINASDETGIDTARDKIKPFAATMGFKSLKIVILDEFDFFSALGAQQALRAIMEMFSDTTRFILTANYVEKIIEPIISRTQQFKFEPPSRVDVAKHIAGILSKENITYSLSDIKLLIDAHFPDIRKILNECQSNSVTGTLLLDEKEIIGNDVKLKIVDILSSKSASRLAEVRQVVANAGIRDFTECYDILYEKVDGYGRANISQVILCIAEGARWDGQVINKEINFISTISNILQFI